jgi:hypothetical protein
MRRLRTVRVRGDGQSGDADAEREALEELVEANRDKQRRWCINQHGPARVLTAGSLKSAPAVTDSVSPMINEWTMMPSCSTCGPGE